MAVDVDVADAGVGAEAAQGSGVAEAGRVAHVVVAAEADGEATLHHHLRNTAGDALGGFHHVGGVGVEVSYVDEGEVVGADEGAAGGDVDQALGGVVEFLGDVEGVAADASGAVAFAEAVPEAVGSAADDGHAGLHVGEADEGGAHEGRG